MFPHKTENNQRNGCIVFELRENRSYNFVNIFLNRYTIRGQPVDKEQGSVLIANILGNVQWSIWTNKSTYLCSPRWEMDIQCKRICKERGKENVYIIFIFCKMKQTFIHYSKDRDTFNHIADKATKKKKTEPKLWYDQAKWVWTRKK